jgi:hypothetical protein
MTLDTSAILTALTAIGVACAAVGAAVIVAKLGGRAWKMVASAL